MEPLQAGDEYLHDRSEIRVLKKCAIEYSFILFSQIDQCAFDLPAYAELNTRWMESGHGVRRAWM